MSATTTNNRLSNPFNRQHLIEYQYRQPHRKNRISSRDTYSSQNKYISKLRKSRNKILTQSHQYSSFNNSSDLFQGTKQNNRLHNNNKRVRINTQYYNEYFPSSSSYLTYNTHETYNSLDAYNTNRNYNTKYRLYELDHEAQKLQKFQRQKQNVIYIGIDALRYQNSVFSLNNNYLQNNRNLYTGLPMEKSESSTYENNQYYDDSYIKKQFINKNKYQTNQNFRNKQKKQNDYQVFNWSTHGTFKSLPENGFVQQKQLKQLNKKQKNINQIPEKDMDKSSKHNSQKTKQYHEEYHTKPKNTLIMNPQSQTQIQQNSLLQSIKENEKQNSGINNYDSFCCSLQKKYEKVQQKQKGPLTDFHFLQDSQFISKQSQKSQKSPQKLNSYIQKRQFMGYQSQVQPVKIEENSVLYNQKIIYNGKQFYLIELRR